MTAALNAAHIRQFIDEGYVILDNAFSPELAEQGRRLLWKDTGCSPGDPSTWTQPVIRLGDYAQEPFRKAVNTPLLHVAFNQLVGEGRWLPRNSLGTFPVRFPGPDEPGDTGWHVDASFPGEEPGNFLEWRVNVNSKGRALLMLFLFSDVGEKDAPTRVRIGSHLDVAQLLAPAGDAGISVTELAQKLNVTANRQEVLATGKAGTVYLCHPFLVHAAQPHCGTTPRFMAQPPLLTAKEFSLHRPDGDYSPVETAIRRGIQVQPYNY
ncbi:phytanoyl-CoA dioxygenase family protein [Pontibacter pamirensis]|uniref:phytanoyl-CoA dioxygenase family protein n=1 Tax=Pontibacter pamirensis TaxID=2562824 RepID=UPI00138A4ECB|nr:phytanoyl-CoA dioxygenase family protein [Pontibacter pamirensis]